MHALPPTRSPLPEKPPRLGLVAAAGILAAVAACSSGSETSETPGPTSTAKPPPAPPIPAQSAAQRLTAAQYANAIHAIFGDDITAPSPLEPDQPLEGFVSIGSSFSTISPLGVERYEKGAFLVAKQALETKERRARIVPCEPEGVTDEACARKTIETLGRRVWRRPLETAEVDTVAGIAVEAAKTLGDFYDGLEFGIATLLQSPSFLYRPAVGEPNPDEPGVRRYTGWEMATRLAFFLWNGPPDDELLDAAEQGLLSGPAGDDGIAVQAERMLASPRARAGLRNFVTEWLGLGALDQLSKDPTIFTYYSPEVGPAAREETLLGFEHLVFEEDGDVRDIMTTPRTFVNPKLASMYAIYAPEPEGFFEVELPADGPRRGLLGHASVLALYAHPTSSSATLRGKFVRATLLCGTIPPPPVDVNTALPEPSEDAKTLRERVKIHLEDPICAGCHLQMDPIGLGLENFDGLGRYRAKENGALIDPRGDLDGAAFADARELGQRVREHPAFVPCFVKQMYRYATSFVETPDELAVLSALTEQFVASGHRVRALMLAIATSPGFRIVGEAK